MPMALELPNKELTPQMERHSGVGGKGRRWCEVEKEWLAAVAKVVSSGLWNQELLYALYSILRPCTNATATPTPPPMLSSPNDLCSKLAWLEC
ncbi:hypothetical protein PBY51_024715 [Eleginops maclovinus]|uniref:Uncharacterized protein n=1 Tax=Eleginops maclovinus TaxID=56733 RepID=A0AAN7Y082_ELEMC|nr:hypothetical protein PBY51_024715 [Eleginops maclovinus]